MKDFIANLKSAGFKRLAIDHGEKMVAGLIGIMLVFALWGSNWASYEKTPDELTQKVQSARNAIAQGNWANSDDAKKGLYTPKAGLQQEQVTQLLTDDLVKRSAIVEEQLAVYQLLTPLSHSIYPTSEPAQQPESLPVEDLIATAGRAVIPQATVQEIAEAPAAAPQVNPNQRQVRGANNNVGGPGGVPGGAGGPVAAGGAGMESGLDNAKGRRYVAIRGIVPLLRQITRVSEALNISPLQASNMVDYWDFTLERRSKPLRGGADFGKWEKVDIRTAMEVLRDSAGWDPEILELSLTDPVLTMSLPTRKLYEWHMNEVSHPKVDNYVLPSSERDRQMQIYENYLDQQIEEAGSAKEQEKGGLSALQGGSRDFGRDMAAGPGGGMGSQSTQDFVSRIAQGLDRDNPERVKRDLLSTIMKNQTAAGRLLLFRYLDFDVKPGTTYQYRVQLVMANPNYERPEHLVLDPEFTKERFLTTPFSQPTAEVTVPAAVNYYVTKVEEEKGSNPPSATFDIYEWSTEYGATINQKLRVLFGSFIGDRTEAELIDVAHGRYYEETEVEFKSDDVLVDILDAPKSIDVDEHPDLKGLSRDALRRGLGVAEQALVANEFGELVAFDPVSLGVEHIKSTERYLRWKKDTEVIIDRNAASGDPMGPDFTTFEDQFGAPGAGPESDRRASRARKKSLRRRGSRRGGDPMPGAGIAP